MKKSNHEAVPGSYGWEGGLQKTKLIDYVNQSAKGFKPTWDAPIPSDAKFKDTKLFSIFLYSATPYCCSIFVSQNSIQLIIVFPKYFFLNTIAHKV